MRACFRRWPRIEHGALRFAAFQCSIHELFDVDWLTAAIRAPRHLGTRQPDYVASFTTSPFKMRVVRKHDASILGFDDPNTVGYRVDDALVEEPQRLDLPFTFESDGDVSNDFADTDWLTAMIGEQ